MRFGLLSGESGSHRRLVVGFRLWSNRGVCLVVHRPRQHPNAQRTELIRHAAAAAAQFKLEQPHRNQLPVKLGELLATDVAQCSDPRNPALVFGVGSFLCQLLLAIG